MEESWVVDVMEHPIVEDTADGLTIATPGWRRRFTFIGDDAAVDAWTCQTKAQEAGFEAKVEKVKRVQAPVAQT